MAKAKKQHTITVTVTAPAWLTRTQVKKEVRTLINESTPWGHVRLDGAGYEEVNHGDIKVRRFE